MIISEKEFQEIYDKYFESICKFLNYYTHDLQSIEDVVQDVFIKLWTDRHSTEIRYIKTYLFNSARNKMLNLLRDQENNSLLLTSWAQTELEQNRANDCIDRDFFLFCLYEAVNSLPDKCKEIFIASREEGLSYKEIAQKYGISIKTVENQMGIALKKIRNSILARNSHLSKIIHFML